MMTKLLLIGGLILRLLPAFGYDEVNAVATEAGGYDIPIKIYLPEGTQGPVPVHFYIHGGGWNGGDDQSVPPATISGDAKFLCDRLGIIYVGLAYRCKGNNGTFELAIEDLEASVRWFMDRAEEYGADLTRIGFGGSSAGSTLSAVMAQRYPNCRLYIGNEGMYNIVDHDDALSPFPNEEARRVYGLVTKAQQRLASAYYNLKTPPPATLLLQGKEDMLCHFSQSEKFAEKIRAEGGTAKLVLYDDINHTCLNIHYPEVFGNSVREIARLFTEEFELEGIDLTAVDSALDDELASMFPYEDIPASKLPGRWRGRWGTLSLSKNGKGSIVDQQGRERPLTYELKDSFFLVFVQGEAQPRTFFLRKNDRAIYELITEAGRRKNRRFDYVRL